jgi:uncharacterized protein YoxC
MLEQARDVVIIIAGVSVAAAALMFTILMIVLFRKVSPTVNAAREFFTDLRSVSSVVTGQVVKPLTKGAIFAAGVRKAVVTLSKGVHGKEKHDGKRK